jgi:phosphate uptake regulator
MNMHKDIQILRLHLLDMSRASQRNVDYSIKAYKVGIPEFCTNVHDNTSILHREIIEIAGELLLMELPLDSDLRFVLSSERICNALQAVHSHAVEIATNSMRLLENGEGLGCEDLAMIGDVVNGLVRLCVVALFEERIEHAETVLRNDGVERWFETSFCEWYRSMDRKLRSRLPMNWRSAKILAKWPDEFTR